MGVGIAIGAAVLCICTVILLFVVRKDIKDQEMAERQWKKRNK